jgi:AcrR family transcriptional regulator
MINQVPAGDGDRRARILHAALDVIAERGFRGASIKHIAERASLRSPALIYWNSKDKDALLEAVLHETAPSSTRLLARTRCWTRRPSRCSAALPTGSCTSRSNLCHVG